MASIYGQFAKRFSSVEEMEAYKKKAQATLPSQEPELNLQLFASEDAEAQKAVAPSITPTDTAEPKLFAPMLNGTATNTLAIIGRNAEFVGIETG